MSLDFELGKIADWETTCRIEVNGVKQMNPVTKEIIFGCLSTGIGTLDEGNYIEWFARYKMIGALRNYGEGVTLDDVRKHLGLRTNVFPTEPRNKWLKRHLDGFERDTKYWESKELIHA